MQLLNFNASFKTGLVAILMTAEQHHASAQQTRGPVSETEARGLHR